MNLTCFKDDCGKKLDSVELMKYHLRYFHNMKTNDVYICPVNECRNVYHRSDNFYQHVSKHISSDLVGGDNTERIQQNYNPTSPPVNNEDLIQISTSVSNDEANSANLVQSEIQPTLKDFDSIFFNFLNDLHSEPSLSKKIIDKIFASVKNELIQPILESTENEDLIQKIEDAYNKVNSHYKYQKHLKEKGMIYSATKKTVSSRIGVTFENGEPTYNVIKSDVSLMPIIQQIKALFELPNVLNDVVEQMKKLENENSVISNFIQCENWKNIKRNYKENDIVLPCFLYHDDFQPDNPLSGNAERTKIAAFYYSFPVLPQHLLSSPKYIFEALLLPSNLKNGNLELILRPLIEIFKELETEGILLNIQGKETRIFIVMSMVIGDNLAIHELLGFSKSFNAKYFCRFCLTTKEESVTIRELDLEKIRKTENYEDHLICNEYGLKEYCHFNDLNAFHAYENFAVDIMHDIYEGIARYDLALILKYIIYEKKIIDLYTFNNLKQEFDYGKIEIGNRGNEILATQIKNECLIMSASEMKTFIHFLPLIIGHKMTNKNQEKVWKLLCELIKIIDILMQSNLSSQTLQRLKNLVTSYLKIRMEVFPTVHIKPKHHFLLHYARSIEKVGPPRHIMSFSYEQKNRLVKKYSKVCHQRVNLSWSLTYKCITSFNRLLKDLKQGFPSLYHSDQKKFKTVSWESLKEKEYFSSQLFDETWKETCIESSSWIKYKSTLFKVGYFVAIKLNTIKCFEIQDVLKQNDNYFLVLKEFNVSQYSEHYLSYIVNEPLLSHKLVKPEKLEYFPFNLHQTMNMGKAFRLEKI